MLQILTKPVPDTEEHRIAIYNSFSGRLFRRRCAEGVVLPVTKVDGWFVWVRVLSTGKSFITVAPSFNGALQAGADYVSRQVGNLSVAAPTEQQVS